MYSENKIEEQEISYYVQTGEIVTSSNDDVIVSSPLGSCIAVVAYDAKNIIGGLAHIMLPGKSTKNNSYKNRYAINAVENLLDKMVETGAHITNINICLIGGANVLKKEKDVISTAVISSVIDIIDKFEIQIVATSLGGFERRTAMLNVKTGAVYYTIGDSSYKLLLEFGSGADEYLSITEKNYRFKKYHI